MTGLSDAAALWRMGDLSDLSEAGRCELLPHGDVRIGVELRGADRAESEKRGGNGRAAEFHGGWLEAMHSDEELQLAGSSASLLARIRIDDGGWNVPIVSKHGGDDMLCLFVYGRPFGRDSADSEWEGERQNYLRYADHSGGGQALEVEAGFSTPVDLIDAKRRQHEARRHKEPGVPQYTPPPDIARGVMRIGAPVAVFHSQEWHDIIVRFSGPRLELFVDGVLVDEEWPIGELRQSDAPIMIGAAHLGEEVRDGLHGLVDHVAIWHRALTDSEIGTLSGGADRVHRRTVEILGKDQLDQTGMQYWKPRGHNAWAGDPMCYFQDGTFHIFYLFDRRHHTSKWQTGGHQIAHLSTKDLRQWRQHPMAVPIVDQWLSCGTGGCICLDGVHHLFYGMHTLRMVPEEKTTQGRLVESLRTSGAFAPIPFDPEKEVPVGTAVALSTDAVHFAMQKLTLTTAQNMFVFRDSTTGLYHMIEGGSSRYVSSNLQEWKLADADYLPIGDATPANNSGECPCYFSWSGWHYIIMGRSGFWMSRKALGPYWASEKAEAAGEEISRPRWDIYDGLIVPQAAQFSGDRMILAGFLWGRDREGTALYAGNLVFRELIQLEDGTLGMKWPKEMIPRCGEPVEVRRSGTRAEDAIVVRSDGFGYEWVGPVPPSMRISVEVVPSGIVSAFGLSVCGSGDYESGCELRFDTARRCAQWGTPRGGNRAPEVPVSVDSQSPHAPHWGHDFALGNVEGLDRPFHLDLLVLYDWKSDSTIVDACIDNRRTMISRRRALTGERMFLFVSGGEVTFKNLTVRPTDGLA